MTADYKYFLRNIENLRQPIQMQLSKNLKTFSHYIAQFQESTSNFQHLEKNHDTGSLFVF